MAINLQLTESNQKEFEKSMTGDIDKAIKHFEKELISIRTGRAHPALVEGLKVPCYGGTTIMELRHIATIATPDSRLITIEPWDKAVLEDIERALKTSDLGISPENDGNFIRIRLPEISGARRDELNKILHKKMEDAKIAIRNVRKDYHNLIRDAQKNKEISEDHARRLGDVLQKITDKFTEHVDQMTEKKEKEIKSV